MIASNNILPPPGDPGALSRLIMDYRNQKQREAVVNQGMQFDQIRNQGVVIQNQMAQVQLDELKANAPIRARLEEAAVKLRETQAQAAANELTETQRKKGILGTATRFIDGAWIAGQNLVKARQIQEATEASRLATEAAKKATEAAADRKSFNDTFGMLTDEKTGAAYRAFVRFNPELASEITGRPVAQLISMADQADNAVKTLAAKKARETPAGEVEFAVRSAAKAGNFTQASAIVRKYLLTFSGFNDQIREARGDQAVMVQIYDAHVFSYFEALGLGDQARQYFASKAKAEEEAKAKAEADESPMGIHEVTGEAIIFRNGKWFTYIPPR